MRIALDDVTLEVEDTGAGTPVLLLHGWPDAADSGATRSRRWPPPATV